VEDHFVSSREESSMEGWIRFLSAVVFAALLCAPSARAEQDEPFTRSAPYLEVGGVYAFDMDFANSIRKELDSAGAGFIGVETGGSGGFNVRGGYRINRYVAAELQVEYLVNFDTEVEVFGDLEHHILTSTANIKAGYPFDRVQPFLIFGAGLVWVDMKDHTPLDTSRSDFDFGIRGGLGVDVFVTEDIAVGLEGTYVLPVDRLSNFDYLSLALGIRYYF
jgi:opacity protein-like surface antigen